MALAKAEGEDQRIQVAKVARLLDIAGREAFNLAYGREAEPGEWKTMSSADREALVEMGMQNTADAERQRGMPSEDCREAKKQMASKNLLEVKVGGSGSCLFLAVEAAPPEVSATCSTGGPDPREVSTSSTRAPA